MKCVVVGPQILWVVYLGSAEIKNVEERFGKESQLPFQNL
jgi:hypothetical protein